MFEDTHLSIIDKIEAAGHKIDGFKVQSDGQTVASGTDGIFIEPVIRFPKKLPWVVARGLTIPLRHTD